MEISQRQYSAIVGSASPQGSSPSRDLVADRCTVSEAARLARRGRLQDAEALLAVLPADGPLGPTILDLKARIFAQQGRFLEAELCWFEALRQSPGNPGYRRALDYLAHSRSLFAPIRGLMVLIVAALLGVLLLVLVNRRADDILSMQTSLDGKQQNASLALTAEQERVSQKLADVHRQIQELEVTQQRAQEQLAKSLATSLSDLVKLVDAKSQALKDGQASDSRAATAGLTDVQKAIGKLRDDLTQAVDAQGKANKSATDGVAQAVSEQQTHVAGRFNELAEKVNQLSKQVAALEKKLAALQQPAPIAPHTAQPKETEPKK